MMSYHFMMRLKNGGMFENELYDPDEDVTVKRFWIEEL